MHVRKLLSFFIIASFSTSLFAGPTFDPALLTAADSVIDFEEAAANLGDMFTRQGVEFHTYRPTGVTHGQPVEFNLIPRTNIPPIIDVQHVLGSAVGRGNLDSVAIVFPDLQAHVGLDFFNVQDSGVIVEAYDENANLLESVEVPVTSGTAFFDTHVGFVRNGADIKGLQVVPGAPGILHFYDSFDNVRFRSSAVPEPSALLYMTGIVLFASFRTWIKKRFCFEVAD